MGNPAMDDEEFKVTLNASARLLRSNRPKEATGLLRQLYAQNPAVPDVAINLGGAYILQGLFDEAVAVLEVASRTFGQNPMVWINLAAAYLGPLEESTTEQQDRAIQAYQRALQVDPKAPNVYYHLGLIYHQREERSRAIASFQRALKANPGDKDARQWLQDLSQDPAP